MLSTICQFHIEIFCVGKSSHGVANPISCKNQNKVCDLSDFRRICVYLSPKPKCKNPFFPLQCALDYAFKNIHSGKNVLSHDDGKKISAIHKQSCLSPKKALQNVHTNGSKMASSKERNLEFFQFTLYCSSKKPKSKKKFL